MHLREGKHNNYCQYIHWVVSFLKKSRKEKQPNCVFILYHVQNNHKIIQKVGDFDV
jgi:hypothetical protein